MTSTKILMKVLAVLQALSDVYSYYVPLSELTWAEKDKQAIELGKLKVLFLPVVIILNHYICRKCLNVIVRKVNVKCFS